MSSNGQGAASAAPKQQAIIAFYPIQKLGHTGASKQRVLAIRNDVIAFLSPPAANQQSVTSLTHTAIASLTVKRIVAIPQILSLTSYENGKQLHILVRNEHDVLIWKDSINGSSSGGGPVEDIVNLLLKVTRQCGNPVHYSKDADSIDPDETHLTKFDNYLNVAKRCEVRRVRSKAAVPPGPPTLSTWDAIGSPLPFALDPTKMAPSLQRTFQGIHVVMLGAVLVHSTTTSAPPVTKVLAFTPNRVIVCDEESGKEHLSCCLFSLTKLALNADAKSVTMFFSNEAVPLLSFSFPPKTNASGAHVSDDVGVIGNVIKFLLAREGVDVAAVKDSTPLTRHRAASMRDAAAPVPPATPQQPQTQTPAASVSVSAAGSPQPQPQSVKSAASPPPSETPTPSAAQPPLSSPSVPPASTAQQPSSSSVTMTMLKQTVPDLNAPHGPIAGKFTGPHVVLARQVMRLTSKGAWEPRVLILTTLERLLICDERKTVKRSIPLDQLDDVCTATHWEGHVLSARVHNEHDLVVKLHPDCPAAFTLAHIVSVMCFLFPALTPRKETIEGKEHIKDLMMKERTLKKGTHYVSPTAEVLARKASLSPNATAPTQPPTPQMSLSPSRSLNSLPPMRTQSSLGAQASVDVTASSSVVTATPLSPLRGQLEEVIAEESRQRALLEQSLRESMQNLLTASSISARQATSAERKRVATEEANQLEQKRLQQQKDKELQDEKEREEKLLREAAEKRKLFLENERKRQASEEDERRNLAEAARKRSDEEAWRQQQNALLQQKLSQVERAEESARSLVDDEVIRGRALLADEERRTRRLVQTAGPVPNFSPLPQQRQVLPPQHQPNNDPSSVSTTQSTHRGLETVTGGAEPTAHVSHRPADSSGARPASGVPMRDDSTNKTSQSDWALTRDASNNDHESRSDWTVLYKKEVTFTPPQPATPPPLRASPIAATANRSNSSFSMFTTPAGGVSISRFSASDLRTPQSLSTRQIVFPTPTASTLPARGPDGSKNCFFRVKIGIQDAIGVLANEKFALSLGEKLKGDMAGLSPEKRVICISSDEPRVCSGDLTVLLDLLRVGSMRGWVRRDVVMCRSTQFQWAEMGVIALVVGLEKGLSVAQLADNAISSGS